MREREPQQRPPASRGWGSRRARPAPPAGGPGEGPRPAPTLPDPAWLEEVLPAEVLALPWLPWQAVPRRGGGMGKVPGLPGHGGGLQPVDWRRAGLALGEAQRCALGAGAAGLGVVVHPGCGVVALDIDDLDHPQALDLLAAFGGYGEWSPSRAGVHLWARGEVDTSWRTPACEVIGHGYVTMTGWVLSGLGEGLGELDAVLDLVGAAPLRLQPMPGTASAELHPADAEVLDRLFSAVNGPRARALLQGGETAGYPSRSEADYAAVRMLAFYSRDAAQLARILRASALARAKYDHADYLERTVARALGQGGPRWRPTRGGSR